jgi:hypothetical protein
MIPGGFSVVTCFDVAGFRGSMLMAEDENGAEMR